MSLSATQSTPARLTANASTKLPRLILLVLAAAYVIAGLFGRDPWKTDDVLSLAKMLSALESQGYQWLIPHFGDIKIAQDGPLVMWLGAILIHLFGSWIGEVAASRVINLIWFAMTLGSVWYGTYLLGRRTEAQPLALPFGGEPSVKDYGRLLADVATLLFLATGGVLLRFHETSDVPANLAFQTLGFYALARMLDKPKMGMVMLTLALTGAFLTRAWPGLVPLLFALPIALIKRSALWSVRYYALFAVFLAATLIASWWIPTMNIHPEWMKAWLHWNELNFGLPEYENAVRPMRDLPWFLWPTWPLALLALWQWRRWTTAPHIWLPFSLMLGAVLTLFVSSQSGEAEYVLFICPLAVLSAFAIPTMRRGVINTLDWFALMCFSVTVACVWVGWFALHFGVPQQISLNIARQTAGYEPQIVWWSVALAIVCTLCWIAMIVWRVKANPNALWRGSLLAAGGLTLTWIMLVLLWMPAIDYVRSYRPMSAEIRQTLESLSSTPGELACLRGQGLALGPQASLYVFDHIEIVYDPQCPFVLQQTTRKKLENDEAGFSENAEVLWQGSRGADRFDRYRILRLPIQ
ncbi:ArnT family glycosyltransferase [Zwartia vadi]|uniref:ArnT family glycosyltransferase n=1 Tax=Zwartia vadi TaxID=3058168 RepID=UPI0025B49C88|nr:glycosyltransferase [Zwartia vadi]MDN3988363.1 glycosyltransferase [Zwartia vadi]